MILHFDGVTFTYPSGAAALRAVSLVVDTAESVAIVGENGAGKSTLAKHAIGLLRPDAGSVTVGSWKASERSVAQLARRVGYVFQNPDDQLFERTVWDEVAFGPRNLGRTEAQTHAAVSTGLRAVGLEDRARQHPYDLHPSRRRMIALAATLAMNTPIVILDEPTTGQDAGGVGMFGEIVEALKAEGRTVIAITHDLEFCAQHFERVVVMSRGRILEDGPAGVVLTRRERLAEASVEPPQLIRLAQALALPAAPLGVEEFLQAWSAARSTGGPPA